jgi:hypothetical protein
MDEKVLRINQDVAALVRWGEGTEAEQFERLEAVRFRVVPSGGEAIIATGYEVENQWPDVIEFLMELHPLLGSIASVYVRMEDIESGKVRVDVFN